MKQQRTRIQNLFNCLTILFCLSFFLAPLKVEAKTYSCTLKMNSATSITVKWKKHGKSTKNYVIYRAEGKKNTKTGKITYGKYKKLATVKSSKLSYTDKKAKTQKYYKYKVNAINKKKKVLHNYTKTLFTAPTCCWHEFIGVEPYGPSFVSLRWVYEDGAQAIKPSGYDVYRKAEGESSFKKITRTTKMNYKDVSVKGNKHYQYKIRPYKTWGKKTVYGPYSAVLERYTIHQNPDASIEQIAYEKETHLLTFTIKSNSPYNKDIDIFYFQTLVPSSDPDLAESYDTKVISYSKDGITWEVPTTYDDSEDGVFVAIHPEECVSFQLEVIPGSNAYHPEKEFNFEECSGIYAEGRYGSASYHFTSNLIDEKLKGTQIFEGGI